MFTTTYIYPDRTHFDAKSFTPEQLESVHAGFMSKYNVANRLPLLNSRELEILKATLENLDSLRPGSGKTYQPNHQVRNPDFDYGRKDPFAAYGYMSEASGVKTLEGRHLGRQCLELMNITRVTRVASAFLESVCVVTSSAAAVAATVSQPSNVLMTVAGLSGAFLLLAIPSAKCANKYLHRTAARFLDQTGVVFDYPTVANALWQTVGFRHLGQLIKPMSRLFDRLNGTSVENRGESQAIKLLEAESAAQQRAAMIKQSAFTKAQSPKASEFRAQMDKQPPVSGDTNKEALKIAVARTMDCLKRDRAAATAALVQQTKPETIEARLQSLKERDATAEIQTIVAQAKPTAPKAAEPLAPQMAKPQPKTVQKPVEAKATVATATGVTNSWLMLGSVVLVGAAVGVIVAKAPRKVEPTRSQEKPKPTLVPLKLAA